MNKRRISAILLLIIYIIGIVAFFIAFTRNDRDLSIRAVFFLVVGAVGTFVLKRDKNAPEVIDEERQLKEKMEAEKAAEEENGIQSDSLDKEDNNEL